MEFWWCLDLDKNNNETQVCQIMWVGWYDKRKISCERKSKRLVGDFENVIFKSFGQK